MGKLIRAKAQYVVVVGIVAVIVVVAVVSIKTEKATRSKRFTQRNFLLTVPIRISSLPSLLLLRLLRKRLLWRKLLCIVRGFFDCRTGSIAVRPHDIGH